MLLVSISSCAVIPNHFEAPDVTLSSIAVAPMAGSTLPLVVTLAVDNPNSYPIRLANLVYQLNVEGIDIATGRLDAIVELAAAGNSHIRLPIDVNMLNGVELAARAMLNPKRTVDYSLTVDMKVKKPAIGPLTLHHSDNVALTR